MQAAWSNLRPFRDTIQDYKRSAVRRLEDAKELLEPPTLDLTRSDADRRHLRGAMYLAGYAAECLVKAYLIQHKNAQTLAAAVDILNVERQQQGKDPVEQIARTAAGHKILYLLQLTGLPQYPAYDPKLWARVAQWRSSWRYETDFVDRATAEEFIADVQAVVNWISPKILGG